MLVATYHAFPSRGAFLAACDAAGWQRGPDKVPMPPRGVSVDEVGPIVAPPTVAEDGSPVDGEVLDPRFHVNAVWDGVEPPEGFKSVAVTPATPRRMFALPPAPEPMPAPVPTAIPAWKGLAWLEEAGLLDAAEKAAASASPAARHAWQRAAEWRRTSPLMNALAAGLGLAEEQIDAAFRAADAIEG